ncbi:hypothetical protein JHK85_042464 [Glycine max]|nr:hypothetical protein JHK85_042464 [Glycine max]
MGHPKHPNHHKAVVLTSSISVMVLNSGWTRRATDEVSSTDVEYCKGRGKWYSMAKMEANRVVWVFNSVEVMVVLPTTCLGLLLQLELNTSFVLLQEQMMGSRETQEYHWLGAMHVKEIVKAYVLLYETPVVASRYLCTNDI